MKHVRVYVLTTFFAGLAAVLPLTICVLVLGWLYRTAQSLLAPLTKAAATYLGLQHELLSCLVVVAVLALACFGIGVVVRTRLGGWLLGAFEKHWLRRIPGYGLVKETVAQFVGNKRSPFSKVALVALFADDIRATAFVTDEHEDGTCTVFVPTGPNPTSGNIYHVSGARVQPLAVSVESAMRSIISCGAGSAAILESAARSAASDGRGAVHGDGAADG